MTDAGVFQVAGQIDNMTNMMQEGEVLVVDTKTIDADNDIVMSYDANSTLYTKDASGNAAALEAGVYIKLDGVSEYGTEIFRDTDGDMNGSNANGNDELGEGIDGNDENLGSDWYDMSSVVGATAVAGYTAAADATVSVKAGSDEAKKRALSQARRILQS